MFNLKLGLKNFRDGKICEKSAGVKNGFRTPAIVKYWGRLTTTIIFEIGLKLRLNQDYNKLSYNETPNRMEMEAS